MSLTDDWKEGNLKTGWYYVMFNCYDTPKPSYYSNKYNVFSNDGKTEEVLAPVPSYEELQELKHFDGKNVCAENEVLRIKVVELEEKYNRLKATGNYQDKISQLKAKIKHLLDLQANQDKEVETLRDLLKECKKYIAIMYNGAYGRYLDRLGDTAYQDGKDLLTRINTAIGDNLSPAESEE